jgi:hypothetical protein
MNTAVFDPLRILHTLAAHQVRFVLIGGMAGRTWGSPSFTNDLDICYDRGRDNLRALAATLKDLRATLRGAPADLPFLLDDRTLAMGDSFTFETVAGPFDCLGTPAGTQGFRSLQANATHFDLDEGLNVAIASLDDLIRMKQTADRPKDRGEVEILKALRDELAK